MKKNTDKTEKKKKTAGSVIGSILLFFFSFLMTIVFCGTLAFHGLTAEHRLSRGVSEIDFTQNTENADWVYQTYFKNSPSFTPEYTQTILTDADFQNYFVTYWQSVEDYLQNKTNTLPVLDSVALGEYLKITVSVKYTAETKITLQDADITAFTALATPDINRLNNTIDDFAGHGFFRVIARFFASQAGVITMASITVALWILWLILACIGHWRKSTMLKAYGIAVLIPSLLVLVGTAVSLLLFSVLHLSLSLEWAALAMPTVAVPFLLGGACGTVYGAIFLCIGCLIRHSVKKKATASAEKEKLAEDTDATPTEQAIPTYTDYPQTDFTPNASSEAPTPAVENPTTDNNQNESANSNVCKYCGNAYTDTSSKFCGVCGMPKE